MNRRKFILSAITGLSLPFLPDRSHAKPSNCGTSGTSTPGTVASGRRVTQVPLEGDPFSDPKISVLRPPIIGVPNKTYFKVGETVDFHSVWPHMTIHFDGENVMTCCDEVDLEGGWVRLLWEKFKGVPPHPTGKMVWRTYYNPLEDKEIYGPVEIVKYTRLFKRGVVTLKRPLPKFPEVGAPHPIRHTPQDSCNFTVEGKNYTVDLRALRLRLDCPINSDKWLSP